MSKFYITTPIYYVNDKPHIGHAYTTVAADVLARFHRMRGDETFFLTGTDEFGAKIAETASGKGIEPQEFTDKVSGDFKMAWKALNISNDDFIRTTSKRHKESAGKFLQRLKDSGALYEGEYEGLYCVGCENFVTEKELADGNCPNHKKPPQKIKEKNWFFKLSEYLPRVKELIEKDEIKVKPPHIKSEVLGLFKQGLSDFSISREKVEWGIPLPWDSSQTIYVWGEALSNYITALGYPEGDNFKKFWPADVHLVGKDIIKFHCIYWPAMLMAAGLELPRQVFANGFFTIDGQKMSKSLGNVIDPLEIVEEFGSDAARYLILSQFPFGQDGDIQREKFKEKYNADLANGIGNVVSRVTTLCTKKIKDWPTFWKGVRGYYSANKPWEKDGVKQGFLDEHIQYFQLYEALLYIQQQQISEINEELAKDKPWELDENKDCNKILAVLSNVASMVLLVAESLEPFLPNTVLEIKKRINIDEKKIETGEPIFPRK